MERKAPYQITEKMFTDEEIYLARDLQSLLSGSRAQDPWKNCSPHIRTKYLRASRYALQFKMITDSLVELEQYQKIIDEASQS